MKSRKMITLALTGGICGSCLAYRAWFPFALAVALAVALIAESCLQEEGE